MPRINLKHAAGAGALAVTLAMGLVMPSEGLRNQTYLDSGGIPTICWGHTGAEVRMGQTKTDAECNEILRGDMKVANDAARHYVKVPMSPYVEAAMTDFTFNVGSGNFSRSTMLRLLNRGETRAACEQFERWHYAGGKDCRIRSNDCFGIIERRENEEAMCLKGVQ